MLFHGLFVKLLFFSSGTRAGFLRTAYSRQRRATQHHVSAHANARTHSEGHTDHTLILHHTAPRANVPAVWVQLLYMGT